MMDCRLSRTGSSSRNNLRSPNVGAHIPIFHSHSRNHYKQKREAFSLAYNPRYSVYVKSLLYHTRKVPLSRDESSASFRPIRTFFGQLRLPPPPGPKQHSSLYDLQSTPVSPLHAIESVAGKHHQHVGRCSISDRVPAATTTPGRATKYSPPRFHH